MKFRQTFLALVAVCMTASLVACGGGSTNSGGGGGGTNPISVTLSGAPATLGVNATAPITATVANDSANNGVSWSCAPSGSCGTFSASTTPSGTAVTYTAPSAGASVTITATSITDRTKTATATVTVTQPTIALADGSYVFSLLGSNVNVGYSVAGVFTVSGGAITGGEQDFVDGLNSDLHDSINPTGSGFITTADGNLQVTLVTCLGLVCTSVDPVIGPSGNGIETINGTLSTSTCGTSGGPCSARIIEFDSFATSSGTLDLQDTTAATTAPAGGYAFAAFGFPSSAIAVGGVLNVSGTSISTTGTVVDFNQGGTINANQTISLGSITAPDTTGRIQLSVTPTSTSLPILNFVGYIVDGSRVRLVEAAAPLGGTAYSQNAASLAVSGNSYVVGLTGFDGIGPFQVAANLILGSTGTVTGSISYNDLFNAQTPAVAITGGTYVAAANGYITLTGVTDGVNTFDIQLYVDGNGNAPSLSLDSGLDVLEGSGYLQTAGGTMSGTYAMAATGADFNNGFELDAVGSVTTGTGTFASAPLGVDLNWISDGTTAVQSNVAVSGAFTAPSGGISTGAGNTITGLDVVLGASQQDAFDYYVVDSNIAIAIEIDSNQLTLGTFELTQ